MSFLSAPIFGSARISSPFGGRIAPTAGASSDHKGIDYAVPSGTPVSAAGDGQVIYAGWQSGFGNTVQIDHGGGLVSTYAHLSQISVANGQPVSAGDVIGLSGSSGTTTGPNLHFGVTSGGQWIDPAGILSGSGDAGSAYPDLDGGYSVVDPLASSDPIDPGAVLAVLLVIWAVTQAGD